MQTVNGDLVGVFPSGCCEVMLSQFISSLCIFFFFFPLSDLLIC